MTEKSIYDLAPCSLGGIEGQGWARYEDSTFTNNLVGAVYFDPEQTEEANRLFDNNATAVYIGPIYFGRETEQREVEVELQSFRSRSTGEEAKPQRPFIEGHPYIKFLGPGNPFANSDMSA